MNELVSVIIPTWNRSKNILTAIRSVLGQDYPNIEILVCDDGSNDNTVKVVNGEYGDDSRVVTLESSHSGIPGKVRNRGVKRAKGKYIAFLDSDDKWERGKLESQLKCLIETNSYLICSNAYKNSREPTRPYFNGRKSGQLTLENLIKENAIITSSVLVKKKSLLDVGVFPEENKLIALEDYSTWLRIATKGKIYYQNEKQVYYTDSPSTSVRGLGKDLDIQRKLVFGNYLNWVKKSNLEITSETKELIEYVNNPVVSVIIPTKNTPQHMLNEAINSILNQTFSDIELIIVDDNSDIPATKKIKSKDNRIQVFTLKGNKGISSALNFGIAKARGRYIARIDADDVAMPTRIKEQKDYLDNRKDVLVVGSWVTTFGDVAYTRKTEANPESVALEMVFRCAVAHPSIMYRREYYVKHPDPYKSKYNGAEDYELWSRLILGNKISNIPKSLLSYRVHKNQVGARQAKRQSELSDGIREQILKKVVPNATQKEILIHNRIGRYAITNSDRPHDVAKWLIKVIGASSARFNSSRKDSLHRLAYESFGIIRRYSPIRKLIFLVALTVETIKWQLS